jgi:hypothetical protein
MPSENQKEKSVASNNGAEATLDKTEDSSHASKNSNTRSWRSSATAYMDSISDKINTHIAAARYGTVATVLLLSAYGLSQTPLFSRFRTVAEIPGKQRSVATK